MIVFNVGILAIIRIFALTDIDIANIQLFVNSTGTYLLNSSSNISINPAIVSIAFLIERDIAFTLAVIFAFQERTRIETALDLDEDVADLVSKSYRNLGEK